MAVTLGKYNCLYIGSINLSAVQNVWTVPGGRRFRSTCRSGIEVPSKKSSSSEKKQARHLVSLGSDRFLICIPGRVNFPGHSTGAWNISQIRKRGKRNTLINQKSNGSFFFRFVSGESPRKCPIKMSSGNIYLKILRSVRYTSGGIMSRKDI